MMRTMASAKPRWDHDGATMEYIKHSKGARVNTDIVITTELRRMYPNLRLVATPTYPTSLLAWAQATGEATVTPIEDTEPELGPIAWRVWVPPRTRDDDKGFLVDALKYGRFFFKWRSHELLLYIADGRDGTSPYPQQTLQYLLYTDEHVINELIAEASSWLAKLQRAIWVFDRGYWQQNPELYQEILKANWDAVILDDDMKKAIRHDIEDFYDSGDKYEKLGVPWKRGLIFHGPPGNGKTISIKATMHELVKKEPSIPTMYVRSFQAFGGPEYAISQIFEKARSEAPCFLVFEDLDSIVTDDVRSYFLNEVDGLQANNGILMVGSTNHLDQLDPGLSKRPSRFDRKYFFPDPDLEQRTAYCKFWQRKLSKTSDVEFPDKLCPAVAGITEGFSFAYIQEAFVAALLVLARQDDGGSDAESDAVVVSHAAEEAKKDYAGLTQVAAAAEYVKIMQQLGSQKTGTAQLLAQLERRAGNTDAGDDGSDLDDLPLWQELKKQVALLREGLEDDSEHDTVNSRAKIPQVASKGAPSIPGMRGPMGCGPGQLPGQSLIQTDPNVLNAIRRRAEAEGWTGTVVLDH